MAIALPPLSLYVHFPWCVRKCPYCDFNSHTLQGELPQAAYLAALRDDMESQCNAVAGREITSVFFGGGTPSLFAATAIAQVLEFARALLPIAPDAEITLEANPGTIERGCFADYRCAGINRVSLGAQSFAPAQLQRLGRIHAIEDTHRSVEELHAAGLSNFNLDLMYALPEQNLAEAVQDVEAALALAPAHISHYQLTLEAGTVFAGRPPPGLPDGDLAAQMQQDCQQRLAEAGFQQYEVSAYARSNQRCRHNLNYWSFGDYLGIGAGAHGKRSCAREGRLQIERTWREREPRRYLARAGGAPVECRGITEAALPFEFMLNALRLVEGFTTPLFERRTGLAWSAAAERVEALKARGLLESEQLATNCQRWRATSLGFSFLNELLTEFL